MRWLAWSHLPIPFLVLCRGPFISTSTSHIRWLTQGGHCQSSRPIDFSPLFCRWQHYFLSSHQGGMQSSWANHGNLWESIRPKNQLWEGLFIFQPKHPTRPLGRDKGMLWSRSYKVAWNIPWPSLFGGQIKEEHLSCTKRKVGQQTIKVEGERALTSRQRNSH